VQRTYKQRSRAVSAFRAHSREVSVASKTLLTNEEQESDDGRAPLDYMDWSNAVSAERIVPFRGPGSSRSTAS